ncbi:MAG: DUF1178 family protein [Acidiferrobacterales bacterium]
MIVYDLLCEDGHQFEGWFDGADDYAEQRERGLLSCPVCDSTAVHKAPTASHVRSQLPAAPEKPQPGLDDQRTHTKALQALHRYVAENFADVGAAFPEEARKIHYGEVKARNIRGVATGDEFKALRDEGVEVHPLPPDPDDQKRKLN